MDIYRIVSKALERLGSRWARLSPASGVLIFLLLFFGGVVLWVNSSDPCRRVWFQINTADYGKTKCVAVLPKPVSPKPVVIFMHGMGATLSTTGGILRELAQAQVSAVGLEYHKWDEQILEQQLVSLCAYLRDQPWAKGQPIIWIGSSLGAQRMLSFALKHPDLQPNLMVRLAAGWVPELDNFNASAEEAFPLRCPMLLIHGSNDEVFPLKEVEKCAALFRKKGLSVQVKVRKNRKHNLGIESGVVFRAIGEYCQAYASPDKSLTIVPERPARALPFPLCIAPCVLWVAAWLIRRGNCPNSMVAQSGCRRLETGLRFFALSFAIFAVAWVAIRYQVTRMEVRGPALAFARHCLVSPKWQEDFGKLVAKACLERHKLDCVLKHAKLAHEAWISTSWDLESDSYENYVLSPIIDCEDDPELNWRESLWEFFSSRVGNEKTVEQVAEIVVRELRAQVSVDPRFEYPTGVETIWKNRVSSPNGFERIYVASLRTVGIPARLSEKGHAELWTGSEWERAPRPPFDGLL